VCATQEDVGEVLFPLAVINTSMCFARQWVILVPKYSTTLFSTKQRMVVQKKISLFWLFGGHGQRRLLLSSQSERCDSPQHSFLPDVSEKKKDESVV
jgi:hypothetical protein